MYSEIAAAIQSIKIAIELVKAAGGLSNYSELLTAVTDVQIKLTKANASCLGKSRKAGGTRRAGAGTRKAIGRDRRLEASDAALRTFSVPNGNTCLRPETRNGKWRADALSLYILRRQEKENHIAA